MELITKHEAADRASVSRQTIARWQGEGKLHAHARRQPSGQVENMVDAAELQRLLVEVAPTVTADEVLDDLNKRLDRELRRANES